MLSYIDRYLHVALLIVITKHVEVLKLLCSCIRIEKVNHLCLIFCFTTTLNNWHYIASHWQVPFEGIGLVICCLTSHSNIYSFTLICLRFQIYSFTKHWLRCHSNNRVYTWNCFTSYLLETLRCTRFVLKLICNWFFWKFLFGRNIYL